MLFQNASSSLFPYCCHAAIVVLSPLVVLMLLFLHCFFCGLLLAMRASDPIVPFSVGHWRVFPFPFALSGFHFIPNIELIGMMYAISYGSCQKNGLCKPISPSFVQQQPWLKCHHHQEWGPSQSNQRKAEQLQVIEQSLVSWVEEQWKCEHPTGVATARWPLRLWTAGFYARNELNNNSKWCDFFFF